MKTPLDVLCTATHAASTEDLAPALQALSYDGLEEVLETYRSYSLNRPVAGPTKDSHALRPYLVSDNKNAMSLGGFYGGSSIFDSQDNLWTTIDRLKHRLLYCHSIATDDPFRIGLALARTNIVSNNPVRKDTLLANLASFAIAVDPLVRAEIIVFVEFHERSGRPLDAIEKHVDALLGDNSLTYDDDARELIRYIEKLDSEHGQRLSKNLAEKHTLHQIVLRRFSISRISQALHTAQTDGDILTPYLPFEQDVRNLAQIEHSDLVRDRLSKASFAPKDQDLLRSLGRLAIPGLDKIDIADIKAIRDADGFALWRSEISDALHHVQSVMDAGPVSDSELQKDFLQQMEGSQDKIEQEFKSSNTLANVKAASISVGTGFIAPAMTYLIDPSATLLGLQIGGMAAAATGLAQSYPKSKSTKTHRPVMKHFVSILN